MGELIFVVEEDEAGGFSAYALGQSIVTQGETREELAANARDAVRCHFSDRLEDAPRMIRFQSVDDEMLQHLFG